MIHRACGDPTLRFQVCSKGACRPQSLIAVQPRATWRWCTRHLKSGVLQGTARPLRQHCANLFHDIGWTWPGCALAFTRFCHGLSPREVSASPLSARPRAAMGRRLASCAERRRAAGSRPGPGWERDTRDQLRDQGEVRQALEQFDSIFAVVMPLSSPRHASWMSVA